METQVLVEKQVLEVRTELPDLQETQVEQEQQVQQDKQDFLEI